jgi:quercetin dioxygenase-like cupin family protein
MAGSRARLRTAPVDRFAGAERQVTLSEAVATLRAEDRDTVQGHRQVTLLHGKSLRLVLFAFDADGELPIQDAPGPVTLHGLKGSFRVRTPHGRYELNAGQLLLFDAGMSIDVQAVGESDMLLSISMHEE